MKRRTIKSTNKSVRIWTDSSVVKSIGDPAEKPGSVPSICIKGLTAISHSSIRASRALFCSPRAPGTNMVHRPICTGKTLTHIK